MPHKVITVTYVNIITYVIQERHYFLYHNYYYLFKCSIILITSSRRIIMKSNLQLKLELFFNESILSIARKHGYDEDNILILEGDEISLLKKYPETYNNMMSCSHHKDHRTVMQYAQDLISSWVFEDYIKLSLSLYGLDINLNGNDKNRKILKSSEVSTSTDFIIKGKYKDFHLEVISDYTGFWKNYGKCHLRDDKWLGLIESNQNSILLGIDFKNRMYFLIEPHRQTTCKYIPYHKYYGKPAYEIMIEAEKLKKIDYKIISDEIKEIIQKG